MAMTTPVTVIVPVSGNGAALAANLVQMADHFSIYAAYRFNYVILDTPGSTTHSTVCDFARRRENVKILGKERRRSWRRTLKAAFDAATSEFALVLDSDLTYHPSVGMELIELLEREHADIVVASEHKSGAYRTTVVKQAQQEEGTLLEALWSSLRLAFSPRPSLCFACRLS
jgi:hypothetical protein